MTSLIASLIRTLHASPRQSRACGKSATGTCGTRRTASAVRSMSGRASSSRAQPRASVIKTSWALMNCASPSSSTTAWSLCMHVCSPRRLASPHRCEGELVNDRVCYQQVGNPSRMVWFLTPYWYVGKRDEKALGQGWVQVRTPRSQCPSDSSQHASAHHGAVSPLSHRCARSLQCPSSSVASGRCGTRPSENGSRRPTCALHLTSRAPMTNRSRGRALYRAPSRQEALPQFPRRCRSSPRRWGCSPPPPQRPPPYPRALPLRWPSRRPLGRALPRGWRQRALASSS